jgi:branched-chain amino acid transport system ATP-binding protein
MRPPLIEVDALSVAYGGSQALRRVSLRVEEGELVTVIGANGAGKSTLLNAISGLVPAASGVIRCSGESISGWSPAQIIRTGLAQVPEGRQLFAELSVIDNLRLGAYPRFFRGWNLFAGLREHARSRDSVEESLARVFAIFPRLRERASQLAGSMSGGEQQMVAVGRALMSRPRILLMDEPSMGLAPQFVREILRLARRLRDEGLTVLLVEQNANQALKIADRAYVLHDGQITLQGAAADLAADPDVRRAYLGGSTFGKHAQTGAGSSPLDARS